VPENIKVISIVYRSLVFNFLIFHYTKTMHYCLHTGPPQNTIGFDVEMYGTVGKMKPKTKLHCI